MPGGAPEVPPGLQGGAPHPTRSRSTGATPSARTSPSAPTATISPTAYGPSGAVGAGRWRTGGQSQQPNPADPEQARAFGRSSGEA
eukprot:2697402-Alexandrium_andersonii.AAC.1